MSKLTRYHKFIEKGNYIFLDELPQLVAQAIVRSKISPQNYTEDDLKIRDVFYYPERCDSFGRLESNRSIKNEKFDFKIHLKVKKKIREKKQSQDTIDHELEKYGANELPKSQKKDRGRG